MKILITGTAGFIGFHLAQVLLNRGDEVVGVDSINDYYDINLKYGRLQILGFERDAIEPGKMMQSSNFPGLTFMQMNLEDKDAVAKLFQEGKFDKVCHLAAQAGVGYSLTNPHAYIDSNIISYLNILEGARHGEVSKLVYASSSSVYGLNEDMPFSTKKSVNHPISLYAATKKSNELMAHVYSHIFRTPTVGLRFFTVYGPWGRPDMALFLFTKAILEGKEITVYNNGDMYRDFTYVDDIVEGVVRVIDGPVEPDPNWDGKNPTPDTSSAPYRVYNIGNNAPVKLLDFVEEIERATGIEAKKVFKPMLPFDVPATYADVNPLIEDFGFRPNTSIAKGIGAFVKWYREFYQV